MSDALWVMQGTVKQTTYKRSCGIYENIELFRMNLSRTIAGQK